MHVKMKHLAQFICDYEGCGKVYFSQKLLDAHKAKPHKDAKVVKKENMTSKI
jgi:hypothetical protein